MEIRNLSNADECQFSNVSWQTPNSDGTYNTGPSTPFTTVKTEPVHDTSATQSSQNRSSLDSPKAADGSGARSRDFGTVAGQYPAPTPAPQRRPPQLSTNNLDQNDDVSPGIDNKFSNLSVGGHVAGSYPRDEPMVNQSSRDYSTLPTKVRPVHLELSPVLCCSLIG